jgi:hypothetical protein
MKRIALFIWFVMASSLLHASDDEDFKFWQEKISHVKPGMPRSDVDRLLQPLYPSSLPSFEILAGANYAVNYRVARSVIVTVDYDWTGSKQFGDSTPPIL